MKLNNWHKGIVAALIAQILWGLAGPMVKVVLTDIPPGSLLFLRCLLASLILFPIYEFRLAKKMPKLESSDKKDLFLAAFLGVFVNIALYFWGQKLTTVIDAWVITSTGTPFLILYCFLFLKERLNPIVYLGMGLAFFGTLIIIGTPLVQVGSGNTLGNTLMLGATLAGVASYIISKRLLKKLSPMVLVYYFFLISLLFSLPLFLWEFFQNPLWISNLTLSNKLIIAYLVLGSSLGAYFFSNTSLKFLPASLAGTIGYVSTVIAIGLSIIFLREKPTVFFVLGTAIIVLGLFLAESRHPNHPIHKLLKK